MKKCKTCQKTLNKDNFWKCSLYKDGYRPDCIKCYKKYEKNMIENMEYIHEEYITCTTCNNKKYYKEFYPNKRAKNGRKSHCKKCHNKDERNRRIKTKYGINQIEYELLYKKQQGKCKICHKKYDTLCIDHNHKTKKIRGLLCIKCNWGIGHFSDNYDWLISASEYIKDNNG